jgi:hypothetical protein
MDAKSRDLALLSFLSLSCAVSAWAGDRDIFGSVFLPSVQSRCSARPMGSGADLTLKRAAASRLSGEWSEDDYDVLCEGAVVGRIMKAAAAPPATAVDTGLWPPRRPHADLRQRADARGCDSRVRQELAARIEDPRCYWRRCRRTRARYFLLPATLPEALCPLKSLILLVSPVGIEPTTY